MTADGAMSALHPSASFSATLRVRLENRPGSFARLAETIGEAGGLLGAIDLVRVEAGTKVRDVTVLAGNAEHMDRIAEAVRLLPGIEVVDVSDRTFLMHLGGKIEIALKAPLKTRDDLSMAYTPGVARVSSAIAADPDKVWNLTIKQNTVAVVSDGTAVLGLGDIGPEGALPVMEGKAMLFKEFGGVDAFPICLSTTDADEIVEVVKAIAPVFGGINLEDISAPRCFEIEERLRDELDIPVFHDDQHGTAIVTLAALHQRAPGRRQAAGRAPGRRRRRRRRRRGGDEDADRGRRLGRRRLRPRGRRVRREAGSTTGQGCVRRDDQPARCPRVGGRRRWPEQTSSSGCPSRARSRSKAIRSMADDSIVFVMANPTPEVAPEEIEGSAAVIGTGRSDYPNQINNVLAFPGVFRGALDVRATAITDGMKLAAAEAIAAVVQPDELEADYVIPSVFNRTSPSRSPTRSRVPPRRRVSPGVAAGPRSRCSTGRTRRHRVLIGAATEAVRGPRTKSTGTEGRLATLTTAPRNIRTVSRGTRPPRTVAPREPARRRRREDRTETSLDEIVERWWTALAASDSAIRAAPAAPGGRGLLAGIEPRVSERADVIRIAEAARTRAAGAQPAASVAEQGEHHEPDAGAPRRRPRLRLRPRRRAWR